jgi:hypothetical protein
VIDSLVLIKLAVTVNVEPGTTMTEPGVESPSLKPSETVARAGMASSAINTAIESKRSELNDFFIIAPP